MPYRVLTPADLAASASVVKATPPKGTEVSSTPTFMPTCLATVAVPLAARAEDDETPYP